MSIVTTKNFDRGCITRSESFVYRSCASFFYMTCDDKFYGKSLAVNDLKKCLSLRFRNLAKTGDFVSDMIEMMNEVSEIAASAAAVLSAR